MVEYHTTSVEEEIVLEAYSQCSGWDEILDAIKDHLSQQVPGNMLRNNNIREYYHNTTRKGASHQENK